MLESSRSHIGLWAKRRPPASRGLTVRGKGSLLGIMTMTAEQHLARAVQAQQQGRPADLVREAEAALRLRADHPVAHNLLGLEALGRKDTAAARRHFEAATKADPGATALWLNLGKT